MGIATAIVWVTFLCCATAVLMFLVEARSKKSSKKRAAPVDPEQLLAERYARGEIDEIEYAQRLSVLRVGPPLHTYLDS